MYKKLAGIVGVGMIMSGCAVSRDVVRQPVIPPVEEVSLNNKYEEQPAQDNVLNYLETQVSSTPAVTFNVTWQTPQTVDPETMGFKKSDQAYLNDEYYQNKFFKVGSTTYRGQPAEVYMASLWDGEMIPEPYYAFFVKQGGKTEFVERINSYYYTQAKEKGGFIPDLHRVSFVGANARQVFEYQGSRDAAFNLVPALKTPSVGQVFFSTSSHAYYIKMGPLYGTYSLKVDFYDKDSLLPKITWNDGTKNTSEYGYTTRSGCGASNFLAVVDVSKNDLVAAGTNSKGDTIYALKNINDKRLKDLYESTYFPEEKLSYEAFVAARPLVYWISPMGDTVALQNSKFGVQAECGKPVIYLYPPKTTDVRVVLQPQGGFTYSEPEYIVDWRVKAQPNGHLTDLRSNKEYPYLFWEGRGGFYEQPKQGWVVKKANVKTFLQEKLRQLGLNKNETADFIEFWLPRMEAKPYYFITFMGNNTMDRLAPLTVEPKPDTVIRVLMDFTPLDKPISVKGYTIKTPKRTGFTVVEWGGVIR